MSIPAIFFDQSAKLHQELQSFGLNPSEWALVKENSRIYQVKSKHDPQFSFKGRIQGQGKQVKWQQLELFSI